VKNLLLEGRPQPISIEPRRTALLVVDMQNDFGSRAGMFDRAGIDITCIQQVIAPTARVIAAARTAGIQVIYLKMGFRPDLSDAGGADSPNRLKHDVLHVGETFRAPDGTETRALIRDTWGTDIVNELKPRPEDVVVWKTRYSGFYQTELDQALKSRNIKYLLVTGCTTSVCVESTIRDATFRDYSPILLADCTAEPIGLALPRSNHEASILVIEYLFGWISSSAQFIGALEAQLAPALSR
jgi:ureidoacrylate peracid hydrolase